MFLPHLLPPMMVDGVAAYPDEPVVAESQERGVLGGWRTERVASAAAAWRALLSALPEARRASHARAAAALPPSQPGG
jgi:hypothetical protein